MNHVCAFIPLLLAKWESSGICPHKICSNPPPISQFLIYWVEGQKLHGKVGKLSKNGYNGLQVTGNANVGWGMQKGRVLTGGGGWARGLQISGVLPGVLCF